MSLTADDPEDKRWRGRANKFALAVENLMLDGQRHSRLEVEKIGGKEATRRIRGLREKYLVGNEHIGDGIWEYWIIGPKPKNEP